jgi:hypothetical protein
VPKLGSDTRDVPIRRGNRFWHLTPSCRTFSVAPTSAANRRDRRRARPTLVIEAVDDRPGDFSVVGGAPCAEPEANNLHLPALRSATPRSEGAHAARSGGGSEPAPTRSHGLRHAGAQCGQAPHIRRVAQDQAVLTGLTQPTTPRQLDRHPADATLRCRRTGLHRRQRLDLGERAHDLGPVATRIACGCINSVRVGELACLQAKPSLRTPHATDGTTGCRQIARRVAARVAEMVGTCVEPQQRVISVRRHGRSDASAPADLVSRPACVPATTSAEATTAAPANTTGASRNRVGRRASTNTTTSSYGKHSISPALVARRPSSWILAR